MQKSHAFDFFSPVMSHDLVGEFKPPCATIPEIVNLKKKEFDRCFSVFFAFHKIPIKNLVLTCRTVLFYSVCVSVLC